MQWCVQTLRVGLRPLNINLLQKASVCSVCQSLAAAHRHHQHNQQPQHRQHEKLQLQSTGFQQERLLQLSSSRYSQAEGPTWTYHGENGVTEWASSFEACLGSSQSPVDIIDSTRVKDTRLGPFSLKNFDLDSGLNLSLENNGHSAEVKYITEELQVEGGGLADVYNVIQFHFHWGADDSVGSEHTIDGKRFPMEMHIVSYSNRYGNFGNALSQADGLAVLGVFFEISNSENKNYRILTEQLPLIKKPGSRLGLEPFALRELLPSDLERFYRYPGSLTTPPCNESVAWTLFKQPINISSQQMGVFRGLLSREKDSSGANQPMVNNFRPLQPLGGRKISSSF